MVTAYDFYTAESVIGHNTGLYGRSEDTNAYAVLNAVRALIAAGGVLKSETGMTASVLKQDPNT